MLLAELLAASERVAGTRSRLAKIDALAECLRRLDAPEIALGVAYLSGDTHQGRIGVGYATLKDALAAAPESAPRLTLAHIDEALARLAQTKGEGSAAERARLLAELFARATAPEQDFLARLLLGELRKGARRRCGRAAFPQSPKPRSSKANRALRASRSRSSGRSSRCSPSPPRTSQTRSNAWDRRLSSGSSTARACRRTNRAAKSASTREA